MKNYWYINSGELKFIDDYGNDVTLSPVTVRYRKRFSNEIKTVEEITPIVKDGTITIKLKGDPPAWAVTATGDITAGTYFKFLEPATYGGTHTTSTDLVYYYSATHMYVGRNTANGVVFSELCAIEDFDSGNPVFDYVLAINPWEDQDDELDADIQLAALYLAVSRAADLAGGDAKMSSYFYNKYNNMQKELRRKYNSAKYKNITIRPNQF